MRRPWRVAQLTTPLGTGEPPGTLEDGIIVFNRLPFWAAEDRHPLPDQGVVRVWEGVPPYRVAIIGGFGWAYERNTHVFRLSVGIPPTRKYRDDALWQVTSELIRRNRSVVVASGNWGPTGACSELAMIDGVISVGSTTPDGVLLQSSSRGSSIPTLVADGTDTNEQPYESGTSFANARVGQHAVFVRSVLSLLREELVAAVADPSGWIEFPEPSRLATLDSGFNEEKVTANVAELVGDVPLYPEGQSLSTTNARAPWLLRYLERAREVELHFNVDNSPASVRRMLTLATRPGPPGAPGYGAGFLAYDGVRTFLHDFIPTRFNQVFGETTDELGPSQTNALADLDAELGPLWDESSLVLLHQIYGREFRQVFATVL